MTGVSRNTLLYYSCSVCSKKVIKDRRPEGYGKMVGRRLLNSGML